MNDLNNNKKSFNLPAYINIPFFLYQDSRLEKTAMLIAAFFYSLHTSGKSISASKDYLCALAGISKTQYFCTLNQLESFGYVQRSGFTNRKKIKWAYSPKSDIIVDETTDSPVCRTSVENLPTSPGTRTKLVRVPGLILSGEPDTYNKEDIKDNKKLTTTTVPSDTSSSSFFSEKQITELLELKLPTDTRESSLFLEHCNHHVHFQINDKSKYQRFTGLKNLLTKLRENGEHFEANGFNKKIELKKQEIKIPTKEDFQNYKKCISGYEWVGAWMQKNG